MIRRRTNRMSYPTSLSAFVGHILGSLRNFLLASCRVCLRSLLPGAFRASHVQVSVRVRGNEKQIPALSAAGFTVVELLIATLVFSMVLVLITIGVMSFTKAYYRGITQSNTQNTTRVILENISQSIQFSGTAVTSPIANGPGSSVGFCIGNQRFSYMLHKQLVDSSPTAGQSLHVLVRDSPGDCAGLSAQDVAGSPNGTELLSPNMRLTKLAVTPVASINDLWKINIRIVYGDDELLCSPSAGDCGSTTTSSNLNNADLACKAAIIDSQFCAVSELTTTVEKRINK